MSDGLRFAWYGDDFTGASDTLATLAAAGLRAVLFPRVPTAAQLGRFGDLDAIGVAGTARALSPEDMREELAQVRPFLAALHPAVTHYKCCSTFDSATHVGNLVTGLQALRSGAHQAWVPIIGGQPSLGRFCAFGELYATASAGGEVYRIDHHPTMSRHPVTPMAEADLRRHLARQGMGTVASIDLRCLDSASDDQIDDALDAHIAARPAAVLFDAVRDEHLHRIGRLLWLQAARQPLLALGASSVAQALISHWQRDCAVPSVPATVAAAQGPVFLMVGSLSPVTAAQVEAGAVGYERLDIPDATTADAIEHLATRAAALLQQGRSVLAHTVAPQAGGAAPRDVAAGCGRLLRRVLLKAPQVRRVGVAGGDTSSFALRELSPLALGWAGSLAPGVPLLRMHADDPALDGVELMLKGGQMGPPDVFQRLLTG
ncbi:MAG: four-carbon acid sugar kinase family protein [Hydrogenophaga sp.]|uniref:four-carbon acid sugar kinase family protein n=1 Tax=Hydrogenophaga sp. TaxID=1904254 RepID=UPI00260EA5EB|nr:four-carbon acid sugar kinase family protein [Hydrogenophaga sp.]MCV0439572.1 four-carbon acid sugar kinase family protein [Hydrogenophaga sp.]